jgi:hypothetical protein
VLAPGVLVRLAPPLLSPRPLSEIL